MLNTNQFINARLLKVLKPIGYLSASQYNDLSSKIAETNERLDFYLINKGILNIEQVTYLRERFVEKEMFNIDLIAHDNNIVSLVSDDFVAEHHILPLSKNEKGYTIAVGDPLDSNAIRVAKALFGNNSEFLFTSMSKITTVHRLVSSKSKLTEAVEEYANENQVKVQNALFIEGFDVSTAPAVKLCESILREAIASRASDIHIEPYENIVRVRNRIDGVLYERITFDPKMYPSVITRLKIISGANITERRIPQDGRFNLNIQDKIYDFRFSTLPTVNGEKAVIRILDNSAFNLSLKRIGFTSEGLKLVSPLLKRPYGIILLTGPTGCGKTTTLYSFVREINVTGTNIVSVEDPVEYSIEGINQVQVNNKANLTFASALRSILRQDPNVIMIGEIRDEETAQIAIRSAITGHLVFSTLHTNDAPGAISRLLDMKVESYLLADALQAVIAQRLVRRLCVECRKKVKPTAQEIKAMGLDTKSAIPSIYAPVGCPACNQTGFDGRLGIHEILVIDEKIRSFINLGKNSDYIKEFLAQTEFINLRQACINAILRGETAYSELHTISIDD